MGFCTISSKQTTFSPDFKTLVGYFSRKSLKIFGIFPFSFVCKYLMNTYFPRTKKNWSNTAINCATRLNNFLTCKSFAKKLLSAIALWRRFWRRYLVKTITCVFLKICQIAIGHNHLNGFARHAWTHLYLSQLTVKVISSLPAKYKLLSNQRSTIFMNMHYCKCFWRWHILKPSQMFQRVNRLPSKPVFEWC